MKDFKENDFVKVMKGKHRGKRGTIIADNCITLTLRTYPHCGYIQVKPHYVHHSDLAGNLITAETQAKR